ncbi:hypothetical protein [Nakamurella lactea]|uniref:hypothetical protein n=1 Tax=Nakamurella lactea TaxID=459515 RepID=UPI00056D8E2D|nr:hypothetical protein [Nakamurella lactea]
MGLGDMIDKAKDALGMGDDKAADAAAGAEAGTTAAADTAADQGGGLVDKAKEFLTDDKIDSAAEAIKDKTPDQVDSVVDNVADKAKDWNG